MNNPNYYKDLAERARAGDKHAQIVVSMIKANAIAAALGVPLLLYVLFKLLYQIYTH